MWREGEGRGGESFELDLFWTKNKGLSGVIYLDNGSHLSHIS